MERDESIKRETTSNPDAHLDPITKEPGAHPVGTGVGAGIGGTLGAVVGSPAGPVGTIAGAAIGGVLGGLAGKSAAESINPRREMDYWRAEFPARPYSAGRRFDDFSPAYWWTIDMYRTNPGWSYEQAEATMRDQWPLRREGSPLSWDEVRQASRDAWDRIASGLKQAGENRGRSAEQTNHVLRELNSSIAAYRSAAEKVDNTSYRTMLRQLVAQREQFVAELRPLVSQAGQTPAESGGVMGSLQRAWMALTTALGGGDAAIVSACERTEDSVVKAYEDALDSDVLTPPVRDVLSGQYLHIRRAHDRVREWHEQYEHQHQ